MIFYGVRYVENGIIGAVTPSQIVKKDGGMWMIKTGKSKKASTYAAIPLGGGPYRTRHEAVMQGNSNSENQRHVPELPVPSWTETETQRSIQSTAEDVNDTCAECTILREENARLKEKVKEQKAFILRRADLDSAITRLEAVTARALPHVPTVTSPQQQRQKQHGYVFSTKCWEELSQLSKSPANLKKAIRKTVKDIFTIKELTSATPAGGGGKPALDRARLVAAKRFAEDQMGAKCSAATFNGVVRMMGSELKKKKKQAIEDETQMRDPEIQIITEDETQAVDDESLL